MAVTVTRTRDVGATTVTGRGEVRVVEFVVEDDGQAPAPPAATFGTVVITHKEDVLRLQAVPQIGSRYADILDGSADQASGFAVHVDPVVTTAEIEMRVQDVGVADLAYLPNRSYTVTVKYGTDPTAWQADARIAFGAGVRSLFVDLDATIPVLDSPVEISDLQALEGVSFFDLIASPENVPPRTASLLNDRAGFTVPTGVFAITYRNLAWLPNILEMAKSYYTTNGLEIEALKKIVGGGLPSSPDNKNKWLFSRMLAKRVKVDISIGESESSLWDFECAFEFSDSFHRGESIERESGSNVPIMVAGGGTNPDKPKLRTYRQFRSTNWSWFPDVLVT